MKQLISFVCAKSKSVVPTANHPTTLKNGKTINKKQCFHCKDCNKHFLLDYTYQGCRREIRSLMTKMTLNSSGIRDISPVLSVSTNTVLKVLRSAAAHIPEPGVPPRAARVELDEFWSFVGNKKNQRSHLARHH